MLISITLEKALKALPKREPDAYKGSYGHVGFLGGAPGMSGAIRLAGEAALRVGAGKVTIATAPEHAYFLNLTRPELMCYPIRKPEDLGALQRLATHWVIGPGLGHSPAVQDLLYEAIGFSAPLVLDADALHWLAQHKEVRHPHWVLTPHPGEAALLLGCKIQDIQADRMAAVQKIQAQYGGVVVLKGAGTLILGPNTPHYICPAANPAMATAGMGDILSGMIVGLMAQGMPALEAAVLATIVHAQSADRACQGARGMLASDVFPHIGPLLNLRLE